MCVSVPVCAITWRKAWNVTSFHILHLTYILSEFNFYSKMKKITNKNYSVPFWRQLSPTKRLCAQPPCRLSVRSAFQGISSFSSLAGGGHCGLGRWGFYSPSASAKSAACLAVSPLGPSLRRCSIPPSPPLSSPCPHSWFPALFQFLHYRPRPHLHLPLNPGFPKSILRWPGYTLDVARTTYDFSKWLAFGRPQIVFGQSLFSLNF